MTTDEHEGQSPHGRGMDAAPDADAGTVAEEAEHLRATERERLRALVQADLPVADRLHADDFQLITPVGVTFSKEQYLGAIASGDIDYRVWEPDSPIEVRLYERGAVLRYQSRLEMFRRRTPCGTGALLAHRHL